MKKLLTLLLIIGSFTAYARPLTDSTKIMLYRAQNFANPKSATYKPQEAFKIFNQLALTGNAEAMNGLGMLYSKGIGTTEDQQQALSWFNKSASSGYAGAYYNLALVYKDGLNVPQDFKKAYSYYVQGAALKNGLCLYGQGYMLYKGFGCTQNYNQAATLFKKGAALRDEGSYYMLGLCYRNGYGLAINADSAKYWLKRAAAYRDPRAMNELADSAPENADLKDIPDLQPASSSQVQRVDLKKGFKQITHHVIKGDIAGDYTGYAIKFDWSGKHIIGQAGLKLHLERKDKTLTGDWQEEGQEGVALSAILTDTDVVFNNTTYKQVDHYHKVVPMPTAFKESHLNLMKSKDTVYVTGTLRKYSTTLKEPQKPEFIMLIRTGNNNTNVPDTALNSLARSKTDSIHFVAYPNPFNNNLKLRYTLKKATLVNIFISDLQSGRIVYKAEAQQQAAGDYDTPVYFNGQPGSYIITLQYGNKVKSAIAFKN